MVEALTLLIVAPFAASLLGFLAGRSERGSVIAVAAGSGLSLSFSLIVWEECMRTGLARAPLLAGELDPLGALVLVYSNLIALLAAVYNAGLGPRGRLPLNLYNLFFLLLIFSFNYMVVARNALLLFLLVEALIGITVALVGHSPRSDAPEVAFRFLVITTISAFCVLLGVTLLAVSRGTYLLNPLDAAPGSPLLLLAAILFTIGLGADIGFFPFHAWVPDAFPASTSIVNVLSCAEHTPLFVGLYNLLLAATAAGYTSELVPLLLALGFTAIPFGYLLAPRQEDPLRVLAYYAIGEYGVILTALSVALAEPGLAHVWVAYSLNSSLMKAGLFACLGLATSEAWSRLPRRAREIVALSFAICLFSSIGIPPFSGFHAKLHYFLLILGYISSTLGLWAGVAAVLAILALSFIPLYVFTNMLHSLFLSRLEGGGRMQAQTVAAVAPCVVLATTAVAIGLWPRLLFPSL
ncbi:MAG: proton-conducting transporter membrane subunit [Thermofilaceae archaeon]